MVIDLEEEMSNQIKWIQVARGIGIILVILGHTITTSLRNNSTAAMDLYNYIYFFHMAFFFYISGRTYILSLNNKEYTKFEKLKKNSYRLLIPYLSYAFIVYLIFFIINIVPSTGNIAKTVGYEIEPINTWLLSLATGNMKFSSHLWFVYALFLMRVLTDLIERLFYKKWMGICLVISICLLLLSQRLYIPEIEIINRFLLLYIWFIIGIFFDFSYISFPKAIICGVAGNIYWVFRYLVSIPGLNNMDDTLVQRYCDQIVKILFIIFIIRLSYFLSNKWNQVFMYLGNNSFYIYLIHQPFFCSVVSVYLANIMGLPTIPIILISFIVALSCSLLIVEVLKIKKVKKYSKYVLGNR